MEKRRSIVLLVCCSVLWMVSSSEAETPSPTPAGCVSKLMFSSEDSHLVEDNGDINIRSLSPWTWRSTTMKNRISSTIWEAECSSRFCVSPNSGQTDGRDLNSVPIYQNILVLERQGRGRCYHASYRSVAVGCTCVWAKTDQDKTS